MGLVDRIECKEHYIKEFATWEASEQIIDEKKAFWCLNKPGSEYRKVCLYRDGPNMFVYGDYGQFTFDSMTWLGSVYNLEYNNIGYQMEKMNYESKQSLYVFDDYRCKEDVQEWLAYKLEDECEKPEQIAKKIVGFLENFVYIADFEIEEFCAEHGLDDQIELITFVNECLKHAEEYEWIAFLRGADFSEFDEECESMLWKAGRCINQRYFICMYALQVCGEKLETIKENSKKLGGMNNGIS